MNDKLPRTKSMRLFLVAKMIVKRHREAKALADLAIEHARAPKAPEPHSSKD